mmetsp:Transcript_13471/g.56437  ORF Transcript_13471/g.56437 Transcript_13471/m.56437 type:complete len:287 (-) Transcript_13471:392-1252(-)
MNSPARMCRMATSAVPTSVTSPVSSSSSHTAAYSAFGLEADIPTSAPSGTSASRTISSPVEKLHSNASVPAETLVNLSAAAIAASAPSWPPHSPHRKKSRAYETDSAVSVTGSSVACNHRLVSTKSTSPSLQSMRRRRVPSAPTSVLGTPSATASATSWSAGGTLPSSSHASSPAGRNRHVLVPDTCTWNVPLWLTASVCSARPRSGAPAALVAHVLRRLGPRAREALTPPPLLSASLALGASPAEPMKIHSGSLCSAPEARSASGTAAAAAPTRAAAPPFRTVLT